MTDVFCLCSGGKDSVVATHLTMRAMTLHRRDKGIVVYLDTGTGLAAQREYVESVCDRYGWQLWTLRTHESYEELVMEHGFPGPGHHGKMYNRLKRRQLERLAARVGNPHFYTGVRAAESTNRMENMERVEEEPEGKWTWHAPIYDWEDEAVWEYIEREGIPENPQWRSGGRAADCFCGAYASREELLELRADHPLKARWIDELEARVDRDDKRGLWGWGGSDETALRAALAEADDAQMTLCSSCSLPPIESDDDD